MSDESAPTDYTGMFKPEDELAPGGLIEAKVEAESPVVEAPVAAHQVDPELKPEYKPKPDPEPVHDADETFVSVNLAMKSGHLRLRDREVDGSIIGMIPNETALKVISADNPEWPFVEYANGDNEPLRGYVKGALVSEIVE